MVPECICATEQILQILEVALRMALRSGKTRRFAAASLASRWEAVLDILQICDTQQIPQFLEVALRMRQKISFPTLLLLA